MKVEDRVYPEEVKCPGCNWETDTLYAFEGIDIDEDGICAVCFLEEIVLRGFNVSEEVKT